MHFIFSIDGLFVLRCQKTVEKMLIRTTQKAKGDIFKFYLVKTRNTLQMLWLQLTIIFFMINHVVNKMSENQSQRYWIYNGI